MKWRNFLIILFWVSFKLIQWGFATFFTVRRHGTATTNQWVDQWAVCSALKSDTFTLVTVTFEWLRRFRKTKISMKAVYITKVYHDLLFQDIKPIFHKKLLKMLYFFQTHPVHYYDLWNNLFPQNYEPHYSSDLSKAVELLQVTSVLLKNFHNTSPIR